MKSQASAETDYPSMFFNYAIKDNATTGAEVEFVHAVSAGGSVKFLPAV